MTDVIGLTYVCLLHSSTSKDAMRCTYRNAMSINADITECSSSVFVKVSC